MGMCPDFLPRIMATVDVAAVAGVSMKRRVKDDSAFYFKAVLGLMEFQ